MLFGELKRILLIVNFLEERGNDFFFFGSYRIWIMQSLSVRKEALQ